MEILLENVRSFCDKHTIPLRPLTVLVGENSTGKTSFLAMLAHIHQPEFPSTRPTFNVPPFDLGTFDSIATYKGGRYGRADSFSVGFREKHAGQQREVLATYASYRGQPQLTHVSASGDVGGVAIDVDPESHVARLKVSSTSREAKELEFDLKRMFPSEADFSVEFLFRAAFLELTQRGGKAEQFLTSPRGYREFATLLTSSRKPVFALAPVRTKPRRTYDEFSDDFDPEGDHVPVILARLGQDEGDAQAARLVEALNEFGDMSGLYERISVRHLGKRPTDPFQLLVAMGGPPANLSDVGYGVSQTLPIVVQSVLAAERGMLLLQQPEVHLHPRGQAALGSFFARLVAKEKKELVVETHSDYLVDRVRVEVARGTLRPSDVLILFFEKEYIETRIHPIELDTQGNVTGAPQSYRRFFLEEEATLFSRANS
jgi:AAA domain, putative AbiEii toxin, Type IV TA system